MATTTVFLNIPQITTYRFIVVIEFYITIPRAFTMTNDLTRIT